MMSQFVRESFSCRFYCRRLFFNHVRMVAGFDILKQIECCFRIIAFDVVVTKDYGIVVFTFLYCADNCAFAGQCAETLLFGKKSRRPSRVADHHLERLAALRALTVTVTPVFGMRVERKAIIVIAGLQIIVTPAVATFSACKKNRL